jgi:hypothetical protein
VWWLRRRGATGDVMAESRGTKEDKRLKDSFERVCREGTEYVLPEQINGILTSRQLKVKPKAANISGLQLADLIAHPSFKAALAMQTGGRLPENFGGRIAQVLVDLKYDRKRDGTILGWGIKWLP